MSDIIDDANDHLERELELRIRAARGVVVHNHSADCLNCGEPSLPGSSYCCKECRDDDEKRKAQIKRQGGVWPD